MEPINFCQNYAGSTDWKPSIPSTIIRGKLSGCPHTWLMGPMGPLLRHDFVLRSEISRAPLWAEFYQCPLVAKDVNMSRKKGAK